mmetsp:Transcript_17079/g.38431  ORF Transcript_17079/g.38431 Transcript_17079/m.38431 type:complete len:284 (-) Transcript_17079:159-1010(-)
MYSLTPDIKTDTMMKKNITLIEAAELLLQFKDLGRTDDSNARDSSVQHLSNYSLKQNVSHINKSISPKLVRKKELPRTITPPNPRVKYPEGQHSTFVQDTTDYLVGVKHYLKRTSHLSHSMINSKRLDFQHYSNLSNPELLKKPTRSSRKDKDPSSGCFDKWAPYARDRPTKRRRPIKYDLDENYRRLRFMFAQQRVRVRRILKSQQMEKIRRSPALQQRQDFFSSETHTKSHSGNDDNYRTGIDDIEELGARKFGQKFYTRSSPHRNGYEKKYAIQTSHLKI